MSDWQPIETAPKDGTFILGYEPDLDGAVNPEGHIIAVMTWREYGAKGELRWVEAWGEGYEWYYPTHWMPLPKPPL